jgi:hypothetical protein
MDLVAPVLVFDNLELFVGGWIEQISEFFVIDFSIGYFEDIAIIALIAPIEDISKNARYKPGNFSHSQ